MLDSNVQKKICAVFGDHVINEQGVNRKALSAIVFHNKEAMKQLTGFF
jgi:dephospho-CoA kinase